MELELEQAERGKRRIGRPRLPLVEAKARKAAQKAALEAAQKAAREAAQKAAREVRKAAGLKLGRPPILPPFEAEYRQSLLAAAATARLRNRRKAAGLTGDGKPRQRRPKGSDPLPRLLRTEEQKQRAREKRKQTAREKRKQKKGSA